MLLSHDPPWHHLCDLMKILCDDDDGDDDDCDDEDGGDDGDDDDDDDEVLKMTRTAAAFWWREAREDPIKGNFGQRCRVWRQGGLRGRFWAKN